MKQPLEKLVRPIQAASCFPLIAVGSGGSFSTADFACFLHRELTRRVALPLTPMEAAGTGIDIRSQAVLLATAGGKNPDVLGAFRTVAAREPRRFIVLCTNLETPLARLASRFSFVNFVEFDLPGGNDGFLATNSLLASTVLLARSYSEALDISFSLPSDFLNPLERHERPGAGQAFDEKCQLLWQRETLVVLHGPTTRTAAIDLESKFTEAALGNVQIADFRNFAHGRHHWLAKRSESTGVIAFVTPEDEVTGSGTIRLLPETIPVVVVNIPFGGILGNLSALVHVLHIVGSAGRAKGIDPGRPGVPRFGRRIYNLKAAEYGHREVPHLSPQEVVSIERKSGKRVRALFEDNYLGVWRKDFLTFVQRMQAVRFSALVLDYDGTLCDEEDRYDGLQPEIVRELIRVLRSGTLIGIATGRGKSVKKVLRKLLPRKYWGQVVIGYYNGGDVGLLEDDACPDGTQRTSEILQPVANALLNHVLLPEIAQLEFRLPQIKVEPKTAALTISVWGILQQVVNSVGIPGVTVLQSSHSMDVLAPGVSKGAVVKRIGELLKDKSNGSILCIGDRGQWPGNDFSLLQGPYSLSVDEVSQDPATCWNLASPGHRGTQATLEYLGALRSTHGKLKFVLKSLTESGT